METTKPLSREALDEFKGIYREEYGENISDDEATEMGIRLLRVFDILSRPIAPDGTSPPSMPVI